MTRRAALLSVIATAGCAAAMDPPARSAAPVLAIDEAHFNVHTAGGSYRPFA